MLTRGHEKTKDLIAVKSGKAGKRPLYKTLEEMIMSSEGATPQKGSGRTVRVCGHGPQSLREKVLQLLQDYSKTPDAVHVYPAGL